MNMMVNSDLDLRAEQAVDADAKGQETALARMMKAWESKQAKNVRKVGGLGLMAVSLAACGSDGDGDNDDDDDGDGDIIGQIFNLTTDADTPATLEGESGETPEGVDAVFVAPLDLEGANFAVQTLQGPDVIIGTEGVDLLDAVLNGTGAGPLGQEWFGLQELLVAVLGELDEFDEWDFDDVFNIEFAAPTIEDIEIFDLTAEGFGAGLSLANATGYEQLWNLGSSFDLMLTNVGENAIIGMDDVRGGTTYGIEFTSSADTEVVNVVANAVGTSEATGQAYLVIDAANGIDTLNLDVSETVRLDLNGDAADILTLDIDGTGVTELSGEGQFENLVNLAAGGYAGDLELDVSGSSDLETVVAAGGDDYVIIQDINADGGLSVAMGAGEDTLGLLDLTPAVPSGYAQILQGEEISSWDFDSEAGVTGVETLAVLTDVYLRDIDMSSPNNDPADFREDATLDLAGFDDALNTIVFEDVYGNDNLLALRNAPEELTIEAETFDDVDLDSGNIIDLTISVNGDEAEDDVTLGGDNGELDIDYLTGPSLENLTLINDTVTDESGSDEDAGDIYLDIDEEDSAGDDVGYDLSALETISVVASDDAEVEIDAENNDANMNALTSVSVIAGDDADLEMDGVPAEFQEVTLDISGTNTAGTSMTFNIPGVDDPVVVSGIPDGPNNWNDVAAYIAAEFDAIDGISAVSEDDTDTGIASIVITWDSVGPVGPVTISNVDYNAPTVTANAITNEGVAPNSFNDLQEVVVAGEDTADVNLDDVFGSFTLDVSAEGIEADDDAEVDVDNTHVTEINVTVSTEVGYSYVDENADPLVIDGYNDDETGHADIEIGNDDTGYGNPNLTSLTVTGATTEVDLEGDLSAMTTIDLTGVTVQFDVDASLADFDPAAGDYVTYLVGSTSSDWEDGDSEITMDDARETVTFTEGDFGTVVLEGFTAGSDTDTGGLGDRIDLSQLGITGEGQITMEEGTYNNDGTWDSTGSGDIRITDLAGGSGDFSGEIIVTSVTEDDLSENIVYL